MAIFTLQDSRIGRVIGRFGPNGDSAVWTPNERLGDPYYDNVVLLLHMNGTNGSTTFIDSSKNSFTITRASTATITTSESKFGGSSGSFIGNSRLTAANTPIFEPTNKSFTIEAWVYQTATTGTQIIYNKRASFLNGNIQLGIVDGAATFWASSNQSSWNIINGASFGSLATNSWNHVAVSRVGASFIGFLNGNPTLLATSSFSVNTTSSGSHIGAASNNTSGFSGYLDDFRFTIGQARYESSFIPSKRQFLP